jgi:DNA-binding response OmpR family regulator
MPFKNPFSQAIARLQPNKQPEIEADIEVSEEQRVEVKPSILLVDDEPDTLMLIKYSLERAGFDVVTSETAYDAIQKVRAQKPNLVLLDRMLPGMDGLEALREFRKIYPDLLVIMLTALGSEKDRLEGWEAGVDDYVVKPINFKELTYRIKAHLRRNQDAQNRELVDALNKHRSQGGSGPRSGLTGMIENGLFEDERNQLIEARRIQALLLKASRAAQSNDSARAHELYSQALQLDPRNEIALKWLAYHTMDPHEGCRYLERLIEVQPGNVKAQKLLEAGRRRIEELDRKSFSSIMSILNTPTPQLPETPVTEPGAPRRRKLGELLVEKGFISRDNIETAANLQEIFRRSGEPKKLGEILTEYGYLTEEQLQRVLKEQES